MKLPEEYNEEDGCIIPLIPWWIVLLIILCLGEPDILDGLISIVNQCNLGDSYEHIL